MDAPQLTDLDKTWHFQTHRANIARLTEYINEGQSSQVTKGVKLEPSYFCIMIKEVTRRAMEPRAFPTGDSSAEVLVTTPTTCTKPYTR